MNTFQTFALGILCSLVWISARADSRLVTNLDGEWLFTRDNDGRMDASGEKFNDKAWQKVRVPHDWAISGPFAPDEPGNTGKLPWKGIGWYRRTFTVPASAARSFFSLEFDGVMASPQVYLNGKKIGGADYGYLGFYLDATPQIHVGKDNTLAVRADTREHASRWYPGAGIFRSVRLITVPAVSFQPNATFISAPDVTPALARVRVFSSLTNHSPSMVPSIQVTIILHAPDGSEIAKDTVPQLALRGHGTTEFIRDIFVDNPVRWDLDSPQLYTANLTVSAGKDTSTDTQSVRFGLRTIEFTATNGFLLNGRRVQLHGVNLHSDLGPLGMAFNKSAARRQLALMKDMGANALRTSHNPCAPEVLDLCDEMGILVWDECFDKWDGTSGRKQNQNLEEYISRNLRTFVRRDRSHPSVIVWSIGNEIGGANAKNREDPGLTRARCAAFRKAILECDETRPIANASWETHLVNSDCFEDLDLTGWNYHGSYEAIHTKYPDKPVIYSESASALSSYGFYEQPPAAHKTDYAIRAIEVGSYDHNSAPYTDIPDQEFARMERDTYCCGEFVWTGIDYLGEPTPYSPNYTAAVKPIPNRDLARSSYFGTCDLTGIPKDRFFLYRSLWNTNAPTIHILPHWNWAGREGTNVPVYVYTSGDRAELFLNGRSLGRRTKGQIQNVRGTAEPFRTNAYYQVCDNYRLRWLEVPYAPGELKVVAYQGQKPIGEVVMRTAGKPVAIQLTPESKDLPDDGETFAFVQVDVVDEKGIRDPLAANRIRFKLTGPGALVAVGNGNPRGYDVFTKTDSHPLYYGKALVILRRTGKGDITLHAEADNLRSAAVKF